MFDNVMDSECRAIATQPISEVMTDSDVEAFKMPVVGFVPNPDSELAMLLTKMAETHEALEVLSRHAVLPKEILYRVASTLNEQTKHALQMASMVGNQPSDNEEQVVPSSPLVDTTGFIDWPKLV